MTTLNYEKLILVIVLPPFDLGQHHFVSILFGCKKTLGCLKF